MGELRRTAKTNAMENTKERRQFWRAHFRAEASLKQGDQTLPCRLDDISLKGALLEMPAADPVASALTKRGKAQLLLELASGTTIAMQVTIVHVEGRQIGVRCEAIDIDSLTHLRRMIELNAGDTSVFERDLAALLRDHKAGAGARAGGQ